jgi:hypothetical protein
MLFPPLDVASGANCAAIVARRRVAPDVAE